MNLIEVEGLNYFYYLSWHSHSDASSISFIPREDSLHQILDQDIAADKIMYDIFTFMDDYFYDLRDRFDFVPLFQNCVELFEIQIIKKDISTKELSGVIHEFLKAA